MPKPKSRAQKQKQVTGDGWLKVAVGEYDSLSDRSPALMIPRRAFLNAIARHAPHVLRDLRDSVLPLYFNALPELPKTDDPSRFVSALNRCTPQTLNLLEFVRGMRDWAARHGLHLEWIYDAAYFTLHWHAGLPNCDEGSVAWFPFDMLTEYKFFFTGPDADTDTESVWIESGKVVEKPSLPSYLDDAPPDSIENTRAELYVKADSKKRLVHCEVLPWEPLYEKWATFAHGARRNFESSLRRYREDVEALAAATQPLRKPGEIRQSAVFDWVALWQCCGLSHKQIADFEATRGQRVLEESAIQHGIERAALQLGMSEVMRQGSRGRKRKNQK